MLALPSPSTLRLPRRRRRVELAPFGFLPPLVSRKASSPGPSNPAEWAGLVPFLDWDPANATADGGGLILTMPDSSGNGRDASLAAPGSYPFATLPAPTLIASDTAFGGAPSIEFRGNPNAFASAPALVLPALPAGPISIALVVYSDMPDHGLMPGGGGAGTFTNNYALSCEADALGVYADGAASRSWGGWLDSGYGEPVRSVDFASNPHVILLTSSGETSPGAADAVVRLYTNALTPTVLGGRAPFAGGACVLGSYQGSMMYVLQGAIARVLAWDVELTTGVQSTASINALGAKYVITVTP